MSRQRDVDPVALVGDPSFVPARAHLGALLDALEGGDAPPDDKRAEAIERALARAGEPAAKAAMERFDASRRPLRARLVRLVGRIAQQGELVDWLCARLDDADDKARRNAVVALGKHRTPTVEAALLARLAKEERVEHRRSLASSLGKVGGPASLAALRAERTDDAELRRIVSEAMVKLERTTARSDEGRIDPAARVDADVWFHCRSGIERILEEELGEGSRVVGPGIVGRRMRGPLGGLFSARTALRFGFPLRVPERADSLEARVIGAVTSDESVALLRSLTHGAIRYRIEWASAGHRRAATYRVASAISEKRPELRNDPTQSLWELVVSDRDGITTVEAWPKALLDPRFPFRVADVPASSHPTLAAALAHVAGVRRHEVVWDPFVGAGAELIERARLGPVHAMYGCDTEARAIEAAKKNLAAAGVSATLVVADARTSRPPEPVSLVITNPPMGRRVLDRRSIEPLFDALLANVVDSLRRDGRIVWLSPLFGRGVELAKKHGLRADRRGAIDLGGFDAELQVLEWDKGRGR